MTKNIANIIVPDSQLAKDAADVLHEYGSPLLWNHSHRVFLFGSLLGRQEKVMYDPELLYISALFHDLGLTSHYQSPDKRFEVDGADAARSFLEQHGIPHEAIRLVWEAIALHNTRGIAQYMESVVALLYRGVVYDVTGIDFEKLSEKRRSQVVSAFPRDGFKQKMLQTLLDSYRHKPETTFGNIHADVCERYLPGYKRPSFCDFVLQSPWNE